MNKIEEKHEEIRRALVDNGSQEFGDFIVDDICKVFNYPTTTDVLVTPLFRELMQEVYRKLQDRFGIMTGDIDPATSFQLETAEEKLGEIVAEWLRERMLER